MDQNYSKRVAFGGATIEYKAFDLAAVKLVFDEQKLAQDGVRITAVVLDGEVLGYSERFGISLATLLRQSPSIFTLFDVGEVVARALKRKKVAGRVLITIDRTNPLSPKALAVARFDKRFLALSHVQEYLAQCTTPVVKSEYLGEGMFSITHDLAASHAARVVESHSLSPAIVMKLFIDGWGRPSAGLAFRRLNSGEIVAAAVAPFRSEPILGENTDAFVSNLVAFVRDFEAEKGFTELAARIEAAHLSRASLGEIDAFAKTVAKSTVSSEILKHIEGLVTKSARVYGLSSLVGLSKKRTSVIPSIKSIAELLFLGAGLCNADHTGGTGPIAEWISKVLADPEGFDLEGSLDSPVIAGGEANTSPVFNADADVGSALPTPRASDAVGLLGAVGVGAFLRSKPTKRFDQGEADDGFQEDSPTE